MQTPFLEYYNSFYKKLALIDRESNDFGKISALVPSIQSSDRVLDIGSGYGSVSAHFLKYGCHVSAIEVNDDAIEHLKKIGITPINLDISQGIHLEKKFDIILLLDILEHLFDPVSVLSSCQELIENDGYVLVTIPLYFDLLDRVKILFTGSIISIDNYCYGPELYNAFRSFNYDHIRFFRPREIFEMVEGCNFVIDKCIYTAGAYSGDNKIYRIFSKLLSNSYSLKLFPNLIAHRMSLRLKKK